MVGVAHSLWLSLHAVSVAFAVSSWAAEENFGIRDAYKWLYHASLGGEHAISNRASAERWLDREWETLGEPLRGEPMIVRLTPDGSIVRLNLRPYKQRGLEKSALLDAFVLSAQEFAPDRSRFVTAWRLLNSMLRVQPIGKLSLAEWEALDREMSPLGYPAVHHSEAYERASKPAYRVLTGARVRSLVGAT
jgi:hypothetical protein